MSSLFQKLFGQAPNSHVPVKFITAEELAPTFCRRDVVLDHSPVRGVLGDRSFQKLDLGPGYWTEAPLFIRFPRARVDPHWGLVQTSPAVFLEESAHSVRWYCERLSGLPRSPLIDTEPNSYLRADGELDTCSVLDPERKLDGTHLLLGHWAAHNYGHFLLDCLVGAFAFAPDLRSDRVKLLTRPLLPWQRALLLRLEIPDSAIVETKDDRIDVEDLVYPSALTCGFTINPGPFNRALFDALRTDRSTSAPRRIYVSRATRKRSRVMTNEAALLSALKARGFESIDPGVLDIEAQIRTFSNAEIIVGATGSGLTNIGYAPPPCAVVEIMPETLPNPWLAHLAHVLDHRYTSIAAPTQPGEVAIAGQLRTDVELDFETPLEPTLAAIDAFLRV